MKHFERLAALTAATAVCLLSAGYTFGLHDGFLGYRDEAGRWTMTQIPADSVLRDGDRVRLTEGIELTSEQALAKALEDFCS